MPIQRHPRAFEDLDEIAAFLQVDSQRVAERFLQAAEASFALLAGQPHLGRRWESSNPALEGLRSFPVRDFSNWRVFYRPTPDGIEVLRDLHGARDLPRTLDPQG